MRLRLFALLALCAMFVLGVAAHESTRRASVSWFVEHYGRSDSEERMALAQRFLALYPAGKLLSAYEAHDPSCHIVAHEMGKAVYQKVGSLDGATKQCGNWCSDGCFHGVLMEMFSADADIGPLHRGDAQEVVGYAATAAKDLCSRASITRYVRPWKCLHGLGHMLAFGSGYDLDVSIRACETVEGGPFAHGLCASGVFMELMDSPTHRGEFSKNDLYPCDSVENEYAIGCFRFKAEILVRDWNLPEVYAACRKLGTDKRRACFMGVGWGRVDVGRGLTDYSIMCNLGDVDDDNACIEGAGAFTAINSNIDEDRCTTLPSPYRESCQMTRKEIRGFEP